MAMNEQVVCPGLPQSSGSLLFSEGTHSCSQGTREATAESTGAVHTMHPRGPCERRLWPAAGHAYPDPGRTQKPAEAGGGRKALPGSCSTARCNASVATVKRDEADGGRPVSGGGTVLGRPGPHARGDFLPLQLLLLRLQTWSLISAAHVGNWTVSRINF